MSGKGNKSMWGGRFSDKPDEFMVEFGASLDVDIELLDVDIQGSIAWVAALEQAGILNDEEVKILTAGLEDLSETLKIELEEGTFIFDHSLEDVHMTVESRLIDHIGDVGAKLHTGRSRNDQVATDERLYLLGAIDSIKAYIRKLQQAIVNQAEQHIDDIVPAYTHLQQAQPVRLGHYLMAWFHMLQRDIERLKDTRKRTDKMPLGSGAVAGSGFAIDRKLLAQKLGFSDITENSIDATSDRDYIIETISASSILMMHLSRMCEDLIIWSSAEFGFAELSERYSTGSSMMPQKKNPDSLELVRGKTGRVYGNLMAILTVMKGLPFSYGKDMQEDKEPLFDTLKTVTGCLRVMTGVIEEIVFKTERMEAVFDDSVFATDIADFLTKKGIPFRKSHEIAGKLVKWSKEHGKPLKHIPTEVLKKHSELLNEHMVNIFDFKKSTDRRSLAGGTGKASLQEQIEHAKKILLQGGDV
ncbi:MAG: argininosuccinate lyase [Candidatus Latescibacteria bacterium]|nr:argininosuccinate lyase [Candidatus Latescibacterota bacterium]